MKNLVFLLLLSLTIFFLWKIGETKKQSAMNEKSAEKSANAKMNCSAGWKITGYFTPLEEDYHSGERTEIEVRGLNQKISLDSEFLKTIKTEGWGKTKEGWYLGFDHARGRWVKSRAARDGKGNALEIGMVAADPSLMNKKIKIPALPDDWGEMIYTVTDIGLNTTGELSVTDRHIDIYTGEGKAAEQETFRITRYRRRDLVDVCVVE
jgi:hypothetical protein